MVKYTKYQYGYPTIWSHWMYPPKGVTTFQYLKAMTSGAIQSQKSNYKRNWPVFASMAFFLWVSYKVSFDWGKGAKFNVSLKSDEGNWLYGPPDPKAKEDRRVAKILHAPHK